MLGWIKDLFAARALRKEVIRSYGLELRQHTDPMISGSQTPYAWMGEHGGMPFCIRFFANWELTVGELFPFIDFSLYSRGCSRGTRQYPEVEGVTVHHPDGRLGQKFVLTQIGHRKSQFLGVQLKNPVIDSALMDISEHAEGVVFYARGLQLDINPLRCSRQQFDRDLSRAVAIAECLRQLHPLETVVACHQEPDLEESRA